MLLDNLYLLLAPSCLSSTPGEVNPTSIIQTGRDRRFHLETRVCQPRTIDGLLLATPSRTLWEKTAKRALLYFTYIPPYSHFGIPQKLQQRLSSLAISIPHELIQPISVVHLHRRSSVSKRIQNSAHIVHHSPQFIRCQRTLIHFRNNDISNTALPVLGREAVHRVDVEPGRVYVVRLLSKRQAINLAGHDERISDLGGYWKGGAVEDWVCGLDGGSGIAELAAMDHHAADVFVVGRHDVCVGLPSVQELDAVGLMT